ncbi:MAG: hypothetical protein FWG61_06055 [Firmicutes bacterium]|nr:hypothetical protein [Bacillota bacterium]
MLTLLYKLQKLEAKEAAILAAQKDSVEYRRLQEQKAAFDTQKKELIQIQEELSLMQQQIKTLPDEIMDISVKLEQEKAAVYDGSIANIREFNARQAQISALEEKSSTLTEQQMQKKKEFKSALRQAKQMQQNLEVQYKIVSEEYRQYDELRQGWRNELNALSLDKDALIAKIDNADLAWYEEVKPLFAGLPIAKLDNNKACDGCRTMVTPILYKRTVQGERTRCEKCGRYLICE